MSAPVVTSVQSTLASVNDLLAFHTSLLERTRNSQADRLRALRAHPSVTSSPEIQSLLKTPLIPSPARSPSPSPPSSPVVSITGKQRPHRPELPPAKRARWERYKNYVPEEETIRNDYSQRYVDGGEWPQDWVLGADPEHRFEEYPKQQRLLALKKAAVQSVALPPTYLPFSQLSSLSPSKFDVILIDPPFSSSFTWETLQDLPIPALASDPSFVLMWVGSGAGDGLERGREVMAKWGFRRCEDIVWIKTNKETNLGPGTDPPTTSLLTQTKQHCLMGIRGTVRRSTDSWFVHCNVDTDVMIYEPDPTDPTLKPPETYTLIENFCLGLRRLEIFGRARTLRRGWVTALAEGEEELLAAQAQQDGILDSDRTMSQGDDEPTKWDRESWEARIKELVPPGSVKLVVPMTSEIDALRPKSPVRGGSSNHSNVNGSTPSNMGAGLPNTPQNLSTMAVPMAAQGMQSPRVGTGVYGGGNLLRPNRDSQPNRMMGPPRMNMVNMGGLNAPNTSVMVGMNGGGVNMGGDLGGMGMGAMNMGMGMGRGLGLMPWQEMGNIAGMNVSGGMGGMGLGGMGNLQGHSMGMNVGGPPPRFNQNMGLSGGVSLGTTGMNMNSGNTAGFGAGQQHSQMGGMGMVSWHDNQFTGPGMGVQNGAMWEGDQGMIGIGSMGISTMGMNEIHNGIGIDQMGNMGSLGMGNINMGMNQWG